MKMEEKAFLPTENFAQFLEHLEEGGIFHSVLNKAFTAYSLFRTKLTQGKISLITEMFFRLIEKGLVPLALRVTPLQTLEIFVVKFDTRLNKFNSKLYLAIRKYSEKIVTFAGLQFISKESGEIHELRQENRQLLGYLHQRGVKISFLEKFNLELLNEKNQMSKEREDILRKLQKQNNELEGNLQSLGANKRILLEEISQLKRDLQKLEEFRANSDATISELNAERNAAFDSMEKLSKELRLKEVENKQQLEIVKQKHRKDVENLTSELKLATDEIKATEEKAAQLTGTVVELLAQREIKENTYGSPSTNFRAKKNSNLSLKY